MNIRISTSVSQNLIQARELQPVRENNRGSARSTGPAESLNDKVSLSSSSRGLMENHSLTDTEANPKDLRSERIERLRYQIQSGTYTPDPERIARAMISVHRDAML